MSQYPFPDLDDDGREIRPAVDAAEDTDPDTADIAASHDDADRSADAGSSRSTGEGFYCTWNTDADGSFRLHARLDAESGDIVAKALDEARDQLFLHGNTEVTTADALREVCERSLDTIESPSRRNRFKIAMFFETDGSMSDTGGRQRRIRHRLPQQLHDVTASAARIPRIRSISLRRNLLASS